MTVSGEDRLQIDIQDNFERSWYVTERVVAAVLFVFVLLGVAGVLGDGPLSQTSVMFPGQPIKLSYDRFVRERGDTELVFEIQQSLPTRSLVLTFDDAFLKAFKITSSVPAAQTMAASGPGLVYDVDLGPDHKGRITFAIEPRSVGPLSDSITYGGSKITLHQFGYP
jgi:hypothetical protein